MKRNLFRLNGESFPKAKIGEQIYDDVDDGEKLIIIHKQGNHYIHSSTSIRLTRNYTFEQMTNKLLGIPQQFLSL